MHSTQSASRLPQIGLNLVALAVTLILNTLANTLPLAGRTTGEISDSFSLLFVPAGYVFSIWGLIYLVLAATVAGTAVRALRWPTLGPRAAK